MAVLEAVRGWEQIAGLPHINDVKKEGDEVGEEFLPSDVHEIPGEETERQVENILKTNYVSLLMEHDQYVDHSQLSSTSALLSHAFHHLLTCHLGLNVASYISRTFAPALDYIRSFISTIDLNPPSIDAADVSQLRQLLSDAETDHREAEEKFRNAQQDLEDLFKPTRFGKDGEWKKLDQLCLEKDTGGYVSPTPRDIQSFTSPQVHVRGLPLWGSKTEGKLRWFCALPGSLLFLEE